MELSGPWWANNNPIDPKKEEKAQEALFRVEFETNQESAFKIAAQNFYQFWLNGEWTGYGPARASHGRLTVDEWKLPASLLQNKNTITVQVFWEGVFTFDHVCGTPGLWLRLESETGKIPFEVWATGKTGRCDMRRFSVMRGWIEDIDRRALPEGWPCGEWNHKDWQKAVLRDNDPAVILEPRDIKPYFLDKRYGQCVTFAGACNPQNRTPHRNLRIAGDAEDAENDPSRVLHEEHLCPSAASDCNLSALAANGSGIAILGADPDGLDRTVQLDFGKEVTGLIELCLDVPAGTVVDIGWSEGLWQEELMGCWARSDQPSGSVCPRELCDSRQSARYICRGGERETINSLFIAAFRYLRIAFRLPEGDSSSEIRVHHIFVRSVGYSIAREGSFLCSDNDLNRIYESAIETMENSVADVFMDCPGRERGGWLNDSFWAAVGFQSVTGDIAFDRRFIRQFTDSQNAMEYEGIPAPLYPSDCQLWTLPNNTRLRPIVGHTLFWLLQAERHLRLFGDDCLKEEWRPAINKVFKAFEKYRNEQYLLENVSWDTFYDWSRFQRGPIQTADNFVYAYASQRLGRFYGEQDWVEAGRKTAESIESLAWNEGRELYADILEKDNKEYVPGKKASELTNYIALWTGIVPEAKAKRIWRQLCNFHPRTVDRTLFDYETNLIRCNLYGWMYRFDYEGRTGEIDLLVRDLKEACAPMFGRGQTTIGEHLGYHASLCHGYTGYIAYVLTRYVAGIELPEQPDGVIRITPHPELLSWCQARVPWQDGYVQVWWDKNNLMASLPKGHKGELTLGETKIVVFENTLNYSL
jgi:alpha-L-rhamnosidase